MVDQDLDLIVIGSGPAGEKGAAQAAYFGKRVALVERQERPGGAPVNSGGLPTKTLRETALYLTGFRRREVYGIELVQGVARLGADRGVEVRLDLHGAGGPGDARRPRRAPAAVPRRRGLRAAARLLHRHGHATVAGLPAGRGGSHRWTAAGLPGR